MNKETKLTFKEAKNLTVRGCKLWWNENPAIFISIFLHHLIAGSTPYVAIFFTARIIDEIAGNQDRLVLQNLVLAALISALILGLLMAIFSRWKNSQQGELLFEMHRKILGKKTLEMDFISVDDPKIKDLKSQISQNANVMGWGLLRLISTFEDMIRGLVSISGAIILTITFFTATVPDNRPLATLLNHPLFTLLVLGLMIMATFLSPYFFNRAQSRLMKANEELKFVNRFFMFVASMADLNRQVDARIYRQKDTSLNLSKNMMDYTNTGMGKELSSGPAAIYTILSTAISQVFIAVVYVFVGLKAWAGAFGVGMMTQYVSSIIALSGGVSTLFSALGGLKNNAQFLQTTFAFLDEPNHMYQGSLTLEKREDNKYEIEFKNVSFKYPTAETYALKNVSLKFKMGERLAIVGENGSGKTTFIKLLCRLYDPTEGEILLNGIDIRKYDYHEYMNIFSVVFQDFKLLAFDLGQNVAAGVDYDETRITECLEEAGFGERLAKMEKGLKTRLYKDFDDQGIDLSGGEAQKVALARALYKDAAFIVLDEPTAALDPIAEHEVYSKMDEITQGKTAIFISHRLSSCRFCQDIVVFNEGELIQQGSHDILVEDTNGKYHELWHAQAQYYIE